MFLSPQYAADLKEIRELHGFEGVHINTVVFEMKAQFLDYVSACENVHNPIVAPISSTVQEAYIYSEDEGESPAVMSEQQTNMYMNDRLAQEFQTFWSDVKTSGKVTDVLGWYQERKLQFPMLARFATMVFPIPPSQAENRGTFLLLVCLQNQTVQGRW